MIATTFGLSVPSMKAVENSRTRLVDNAVPLGVEVEVENMPGIFNSLAISSMRNTIIPTWSLKEDHSLKWHGCEFTTYNPGKPAEQLRGSEIVDALKQLGRFFSAYTEHTGYHPTFTELCSVHIHVDCRRLTFQQAGMFLLLLLIMEEALFQRYAPERRKNYFCKSAQDNLGLQEFFTDCLHRLFDMDYLPQGDFPGVASFGKYAAINPVPITSYGSIEIRILPGTISMNRILPLVNTLLMLRKAAIKGHPMLLSSGGFIQDIFGVHAKTWRGYEDAILRGLVLWANMIHPFECSLEVA